MRKWLVYLDLKLYKEKQTNKRVPMIIEHNPRNPPLASWLQEYMPLLHSSSRMKRAVSEPPMVGERNCTNFCKLLMPSKLQKPYILLILHLHLTMKEMDAINAKARDALFVLNT